MLQLHGVACHVPIIPHSHVPQLRDRNTMLSVPGRSFRKVRLQQRGCPARCHSYAEAWGGCVVTNYFRGVQECDVPFAGGLLASHENRCGLPLTLAPRLPRARCSRC